MNPWGSRYRELAGPPGPWSLRSRLLAVAAAAAAAAPTFAEDTLRPADATIVVAMLLIFPIAWGLLARSPRTGRVVGAILVAATAIWSLAIVRLARYETPPNVDDMLRWQLSVTGVLVAAAGLYEWNGRRRGGRRWVAGIAVWAAGVAATVAVPSIDSGRIPPRDAVLPLPSAMSIVDEKATCQAVPTGGRSCVRQFTVVPANGTPYEELMRRVGEHLERDQGWTVTWYRFSPTPNVECRRTGWFLDPYRLCVWLRPEEERSAVQISLGYYNPYDPVY